MKDSALASHRQREAKDFDRFVHKYVDHQNRHLLRTELAWRQDFTALAVGNEDSSIEMYSAWMVLLDRLEGPKKLIQCLSWHPRLKGRGEEPSPLQATLAGLCLQRERCVWL